MPLWSHTNIVLFTLDTGEEEATGIYVLIHQITFYYRDQSIRMHTYFI